MIYEDNKPMYVIGDIHGQLKELFHLCRTNNISDCSIIIAGDCGIGFCKWAYYEDTFGKMNKWLIDKNITIYMIRGNHDDPSLFNDYKNGNIILLSDYSVIKNNEHNILCVGGGISIDRTDRISYDIKKERKLSRYINNIENKIARTYWYNEQVVFDIDKINDIKNTYCIDTLITHSCCSFCFPTDKSGIIDWLKIDNELNYDLNVERETIDNIHNAFKDTLKKHIYGHFHVYNVEYIDNIKYVALDSISMTNKPAFELI